MIEIILAIVVAIAGLLLVVLLYKQKFNFLFSKIEEAELNIIELLQQQFKIFNKIIPIIKEEITLDNFLVELDEFTNLNDNYKKSDLIDESYHTLFEVIEDNEKLLMSKKLTKLLNQLEISKEELLASIKFYNDNINIYNKTLKTFPTNIIKLIFRYRELKVFKITKREKFNILKND